MLLELLHSLSGIFYMALHVVNSGSFPRPLAAAQEREYLEAYRQHGDMEARNQLIEHNLRLVAHIIKKYYASQNDQEETLRTLGEELASLRGTMGAFSPLLAQLRHQLRTAEADQARQDGLLRDTVQQTQALEKEIAQREDKVEPLEAARRALSVQLEQSTGQKLALERARVENDRAARAQNDLQLRLQRETGVLEQRKLQAGMEEKRLLDRLWDTYGMTHQGALAVRVPVEDAAQAQRRTVQLNQAIQALGTVNLGAVEEFQRVEERYGYLKDQKNDVETAQRELEGVIQEITQEMEAIFRREFARIQAAFSQTFADLFGGGQGTLSLEDETDVLRCGIEIRAQPPGKTLRAISLLSGGERSLVAIALSASAGLRALLLARDKLYGLEHPGGLRRIALSVILSLLFLLTIYLSVVVIFTGDWFFHLLETHLPPPLLRLIPLSALSRLWLWIRYLLLFCFVLLLVLAIYRLGTPRRFRSSRKLLLSSLFTAVSLVAGSLLFSWFIGLSSRYSMLYGSLASLIILLVWLYFCGNVLLLGALLSRVLEVRRARHHSTGS